MALIFCRRENAPAAKITARITSGMSWANCVWVRPSQAPASALTNSAIPAATRQCNANEQHGPD